MISGVFPGNFLVLASDRGIRTRPRPTKYKNGVSWPFRAGLGGRFGSRVYGATQISIRILLEQAHPLFSTSPYPPTRSKRHINEYIYICPYSGIISGIVGGVWAAYVQEEVATPTVYLKPTQSWPPILLKVHHSKPCT